MLTALALAITLAPQDPFPRPDADPTGVVLDEQGNRVAGAKVALRCDLERSAPWAQAIAHVLRATPLPQVMSGRDGEFVLPLTRDQRRLGAAGEGAFALVVEKAGHQRWCEPLPRGIASYLGSRVVLRKLGEEDRVSFTIEHPCAGLQLRVRRVAKGDPDPGELVAVPGSGQVSVLLPLAPSPALLPTADPGSLAMMQYWIPLGLSAQLVLGARAGPARSVDPTRPVLFAAKDVDALRGEPEHAPAENGSTTPTGRLKVRVHRPDGEPIANVSLRLSDSCHAHGMPAGPPPVTDEQGAIEIGPLPVGAHELLAIAAGARSRPQKFSILEGQLESLEVPTLALVERRVLVLDSAERPVRFARVDLQLAQVSAWPLCADSEGRLLLRSFAEEAVQLSARGGESLDPDAGEIVRMHAAALAPVLVLADPGLWVTRQNVVFAPVPAPAFGRGGSGNVNPFHMQPEGACAMLVRCLADDGDTLFLHSPDVPPYVLRGSSLTPAQRNGERLVTLDRRKLVRRIPIDLGDAHEIEEGLLVTEKRGVVNDSMLDRWCGNYAERDAAGRWWFVARDLEEHVCSVAHPDWIAGEVQVPAREPGQAAETPLRIALTRGVAITFRAPRAQFPAQDRGAMAQLSPGKGGNMDWWSFSVPLPPGDDGKSDPVTVRCPRAFAPGEYKLSWRPSAGASIERVLALEDGKPAVVDLTR